MRPVLLPRRAWPHTKRPAEPILPHATPALPTPNSETVKYKDKRRDPPKLTVLPLDNEWNQASLPE